MALKRVRFAVEEERCEHSHGHTLRQQQRRLDTALRLQRMSEARVQQMQRELHECERAKAALQGRVRQLQEHLLVATDQVGQLQAQAGQLQAQLEQTRQRQIAHAEASGAREQELLEQLADCDAALRQRDDQLQACTAALTKYQEADKRRSLGGSHPRAEPQQQQPQQQEQQPAQAEAPPAEGAVAAGGAAPAAAGDPPSLDTHDVAQVLGELWELHAGGTLAPLPAQEQRKRSSGPSSDPTG